MVLIKVIKISFILLFISSACSAADVYIHPKLDKQNADIIDLLKTALDRTKNDHGPYELRQVDVDLPEPVAFAETEAKRLLNITWASTSIEREQRLIPIRIPLRKGLNGYRICMVTDKGQQAVNNVQSVAHFSHLTIAQRSSSNETPLFRQNNIKVNSSFSKQQIYSKLQTNRVDLFPMEMREIFDEPHSLPPNLSIENKMLLYIPLPYYFFVSQENKQLANRVRTGLTRMLKDGSFDQIFFKHFGSSIVKAKLTQRRVITLRNPSLPAATPYEEQELWFDPWS